MREPLGGEECVRRDAERGVMMEAAPAPAFEVIQPQLVLELLVVPLDAPAQHRQADQVDRGRRRWQRGEPILDRRSFPPRPFDEQPLFEPGCRAPVVAMRGPDADRREARPHRAARACAPGHGAPSPRRQLLSQGPYAEWSMPPGPADQCRRSAVASILRRGQRRAAGRAQDGAIVPGGIGDEVMHRLMARAHVARIDARGHRLDALPLPGQTEPGDIGPQGAVPIPMAEGRAETLNIRVKPLGAGGPGVGHTWMLPAYPRNPLVLLTQ